MEDRIWSLQRFPSIFLSNAHFWSPVLSKAILRELKNKVTDPDSVLELNTKEAVDLFMFNVVPPKDLYDSETLFLLNENTAVPPFGYVNSIENKMPDSEDEVCRLLRRALNERGKIVESISLIFLSRKSLKYDNCPLKKYLVCQMEQKVFKCCLQEYIVNVCSIAQSTQDLIKYSDALHIAKKYNILDFEIYQNLSQKLKSIETFINIQSRGYREAHLVRYSEVISQLRTNLFGEKQNSKKEELRIRLNNIGKHLQKYVDELKRNQKLLDSITTVDDKSLKLMQGIENNLKSIDLKYIVEQALESDKESIKSMRLIAQLRTRILECEQEKDEVKRKTLQFATRFLKQEYIVQRDKALKKQQIKYESILKALQRKTEEELKEKDRVINSLKHC